MGDAQALGDLIGGLEPDPPHLASESIRLAADHLDRVVAVGLIDPHRQRGRHPHALEEDHHLLDGPLLLPRSRRLSPGWAPSSAPTTVSRSLDRSVATRATV